MYDEAHIFASIVCHVCYIHYVDIYTPLNLGPNIIIRSEFKHSV